MEAKCRAKDPTKCWRHGNQQGLVAHSAISSAMVRPKQSVPAKHIIFDRALKTMNAPKLAVAITNFADTHPHIDGAKMRKAIALASNLHKHDLRSNRGKYDITPYIEHPLRNTLRLIRWGCEDQSTLIAAVFHDTVEDHPEELSALHTSVKPANEHEARENAYAYIRNHYGEDVERIVKGMSNPIFEDKYMPAAKKNVIYADHVEEAIEDPEVCVNKVADFTDNALGLYHNRTSMSVVSLRKKATKYLLVVDHLENRLKRGLLQGGLPVSDNGIIRMLQQIERGRPNLVELSKL